MSQRTRRKAAAPVILPLAQFKIAISGSIPGQTQASIERDYIAPLGGKLAKSMSSTTTHLVTTEADYQKSSVKVNTAQTMGIFIVNFQWLEDCLGQNTHLNEGSYGFVSSSGAPVNGSTQSNSSRKRIASEVPQNSDDDNVPPQPKKKGKASNGKAAKPEPKTAAAQDVDDDKAAAQPKKKKGKAVKAESEEPQPQVSDAQVIKSRDTKIPVDEGANAELRDPKVEVYIDENGVIYDASLNQTNSSSNNNKFYRIQVLYTSAQQYCTWTRWGRVGEFGQTKMVSKGSLENALKQFNDKFKSKSGLTWANRGDPPRPGKYAFIEKSYESEDEDEEGSTELVKGEVKQESEPESNLPKSVQELMLLIFNPEFFAKVMTDLNYDAAKLPLGKLSKATISRGFQALKDLSALLDDPALALSQYSTNFSQATEHLSNLFFTIIPHAFGRNRPPIIQNQNMLKKELELLESLSDMKDAAQLLTKIDAKLTINQLDRQFQGLGLNEMTPLDDTSAEFTHLRDYLINTQGDTHQFKYNLQQIFRIEREGEFARFDGVHSAPRDRRLLWHGSRTTNYGGILSQGLRIAPPEAPMFGKGIYLADMSSKSAGYCHSYVSQGHALLLLCEAELGDPIQTLQQGCYDAADTAIKGRMLATWGQGSTGPSKWKDAECVHPSLKGVKMPDTTVKPGPTNVRDAVLLYNEYICYDISQVRLRYLLRVKIDF
ncbi:poly polymerase catalytic domain-containing protein [Xylaria intraflava]|nr:poly polymerase catalytic domain-containing protein [Xylaria intraflava]